ncbi:MAG: NAD-dependent DNA ligase LigA [Elusimicrobiota bacterium]
MLQKIENLKKQIRHHDYLYYVLAQPEISDSEYDSLMKQLKELEEKNPQFITTDSPTQRVSGEAVKDFTTVKHSVPMLSLENTYSSHEILEWNKRVKKIISIARQSASPSLQQGEFTSQRDKPSNELKQDEGYEYIIEPKIDGISCNLIYKNGILTQAATRGDGNNGEDVTLNIKTIRSIPLSLLSTSSSATNLLGNLSLPTLLEVRGEVYIDKIDFQKLNEEILKNGEQPFANPRNAAAGSLRQKNPQITGKRKLKLIVHSYGMVFGTKNFKTHFEFLKLCEKIGLPTTLKNISVAKKIDEVVELCKKYEFDRENISFEVDGLVIKINSLEQQQKLGFTMKSPRWAIAYKFPAKQATTKIKNIIIQVGRTGILTPVAELEPVGCGGVIISRATLHNFEEVERLGVKIGDTILIERAGEVIPKIVKVIETKRTGDEKKLKIPEKCPICDQLVVKEKEEDVAWRCINPSCPAHLENGLVHFAKREAMDIEGLGDAVVQQLVSKKMVCDFADIYYLKKDDLLKLELFKDKKAQNLLNAIEESKSKSLSRLLLGFGIRNVGEKAAITLAEKFLTLDDLIKATVDDLQKIYEIGPTIAESVVKFFTLLETKKLIEKLKKVGINANEEIKKGPRIFEGKTFIFTGELKNFSRTDAEAKIRELGGSTSSSVSQKTNFVVAGENPGSKLNKAKKLGIKIILEEEFLKMVNLPLI